MPGTANKPGKSPRRKATTVESRQAQMVALAVDLAEQQLRDGTASAQVITHYLKLGSTKEMLEQQIMEERKKLLVAKTDAIQSAQRVEALVDDALAAFRRYSGQDEEL